MNISADRWCENGANRLVKVVGHADVLILEQKLKIALALEAETGTRPSQAPIAMKR
jgi:hypothetical protein